MTNFNPGGYVPAYKNWNYSNQDKEGYSEILVGTVVAIQKIQASDYTTKQPRFWPDGNPVFNIRIALATPEGELVTFTFQPASKAAKEGKKRSVHIDLWHLTGDTDLINLIGKTIMITTQPGNYGAQNPRPFEVSLVTDAGPYQLASGELPDDFKVDEILLERPRQQQPQYAPQMQGQYYQAPQAQQMPPMQQQYMPQPQMQQYQQPMPQQQQPMQQQPQQGFNPMQPPMPQGMNPNVAAAMQTMGATNVQPVAGGTVYDEGIPF